MIKKRYQGRAVTGILLYDKPAGVTSNEALQQVKRIYQANKAGHTGSLDPLATGLLPMCLGEATKVSPFLLDADKHYQVRVHLGVTTTTADAEGEIIATAAWEHVNKEQMQAQLPKFIGEIEQTPPMYSAIKHKGKRLYDLARQGVEVERQPRRIMIHSLTLTDWEPPELSLNLHCSKGTYVRTLAEDLGQMVGCGAYVSALRRLGVGPYDATRMITNEMLEAAARQSFEALDALLLPPHSAMQHWSALQVSESTAFYLKQGQAVLIPQAPTTGMVRLYTKTGTFFGVGIITDDGKVRAKRLLE
jgi:tRNA pseudouridine55 synthase